MKTISLLAGLALTISGQAQDSTSLHLKYRHTLAVNYNQPEEPTLSYEYSLPKGQIGLRWERLHFSNSWFDSRAPRIITDSTIIARHTSNRYSSNNVVLTISKNLWQGRLLKHKDYFITEINPIVGAGYGLRTRIRSYDDFEQSYTQGEVIDWNMIPVSWNVGSAWRRETHHTLTFQGGVMMKVSLTPHIYVGSQLMVRLFRHWQKLNWEQSDIGPVELPHVDLTRWDLQPSLTVGFNLGQEPIDRDFLVR